MLTSPCDIYLLKIVNVNAHIFGELYCAHAYNHKKKLILKVMKGTSKQKTLFQSWGNQNKNYDSSDHRPSTSHQVNLSSENEILNNDDDELLAQALEISLLEYEQHYGTVSNLKTADLDAQPQIITSTPVRNLPGFDISAGRTWIYPTNYSLREYQYNIVQASLFKNTLVVLPTGLGKTFIAAVVMYNFYRWYPASKIIFMAPTKPLVAQQIEACYKIMGIPQDITSEMTGSLSPNDRKLLWTNKRVFFLTPQVLSNDLLRGLCNAEDIKCLVVDEAHRALGNHAYCQVVKELLNYSSQFRILALSATPGGDLKTVQQVLSNLLISHVEIRTESSPDIQPYTFERQVEKIIIPLSGELKEIKEKFLKVINTYAERLQMRRALSSFSISRLSKFGLLKSRDAFRQNPPHNLSQNQYKYVECDFAICISLCHGYELLLQHGQRSFYNFLQDMIDGPKKNPRTKAELLSNSDFCDILSELQKNFGSNSFLNQTLNKDEHPIPITGHPKLEKLLEIVLAHFKNFQNGPNGISNTRVMIFSQYRDSVQEITAFLKCHRPIVKVMSFVGQQTAGKRSRGFTQKQQMMVIEEFRNGGYNTLVSTCVGEEGLDIGDVDLIICYDALKSPIRLVQRMGRTGRKRAGRIVMLVTEGKEANNYNQSEYKKRSIHKAIMNGTLFQSFYPNNPRMIPEGLNPVCHKMHMTITSFTSKNNHPRNAKDCKRITNFFPEGFEKKSTENAYLTNKEFDEWNTEFRLSEDNVIKQLPFTKMLSLGCSEERTTEDHSKVLSLNSWLPWQNSLQPTFFVSHSKPTEILVNTIQMMESGVDMSFCKSSDNQLEDYDMNDNIEMSNFQEDHRIESAFVKSKNHETSDPKVAASNKIFNPIKEGLKRMAEFQKNKYDKNIIINISDDDSNNAFGIPALEEENNDKEIQEIVDNENPITQDLIEKWFPSPIIKDVGSNNDLEVSHFQVRTPPANDQVFLDCQQELSPFDNNKLIHSENVSTKLSSLQIEPDFDIMGNIDNYFEEDNSNSNTVVDDAVTSPESPSLLMNEGNSYNDGFEKLNRTQLKINHNSNLDNQNTELVERVNEINFESFNSLNSSVFNKICNLSSYNDSLNNQLTISQAIRLVQQNSCELSLNEQSLKHDSAHQNLSHNFTKLIEKSNDEVLNSKTLSETIRENDVWEIKEEPLLPQFELMFDLDDDIEFIPPSPQKNLMKIPYSKALPNNSQYEENRTSPFAKTLNCDIFNESVSNELTSPLNGILQKYPLSSTPVAMTKPVNKEASHFENSDTDSEPEIRPVRKRRCLISPSQREKSHSSLEYIDIRKQKRKRNLLAKAFLDEEAEISNDSVNDWSSDESEPQCDKYEGTFVDDKSPIGQKDIHGIYLQSVKSPVLNPRYKLVYKPHNKYNDSVETDFEESEYIQDSFCVDSNLTDCAEEDDEDSNCDEITLPFQYSEREILNSDTVEENILPSKRKRIKVLDSSEEEEVVKTANETEAAVVKEEYSEKIQRSKQHENSDFSQQFLKNIHQPKSSLQKSSYHKPTLLIDSRQIAAVHELVSVLRVKYNINVIITQLNGCDYIVSNRLAVERKLLSDFSSGMNRSRLIERLQQMNELFEMPCLIIEKNRINKGEVDFCRQRTKYVDSLTCALAQTHIKVLYSECQEETATILHDLIVQENAKGWSLCPNFHISAEEERIIKFYQNLPSLSYITAFNFCKSSCTIYSLLNSSSETLELKGSIPKTKALSISSFLKKQLD